MLRPLPLHDEIANGYEGRVIRLNGWRHENAARRSLLLLVGKEQKHQRNEVTSVQLLAATAGMEIAEFVREHTLLPLHRAIAGKATLTSHGSSERPTLLWTHAMREARAGAYFCLRCVDDDSDSNGTPYWRRQHQLPGLYWCLQHESPLSWLGSSAAFISSPTKHVESHIRVPAGWSDALRDDPLITRFHKICLVFLHRAQPLDELDVAKALRARAAELGLHSGCGEISKPLLSDLVRQRFNAKWLDSVVPALSRKTSGEYWRMIDAAVLSGRPGVSAIVYALAFSVLFDSDDLALSAMLSLSSENKKLRDVPKSDRQVSSDSIREHTSQTAEMCLPSHDNSK